MPVAPNFDSNYTNLGLITWFDLSWQVSVEDHVKYRDHIAKMRSLLFRHELKSKRIKKIKSKTYHRLRNKDRRKAESVEMLMDPEATKEQLMKQEFKRAEVTCDFASVMY